MNMRTISYFSLFLAGILAFAGCKSSSTSPNGSGGIVIPNAGSYFTLVDLQFDSTGALVGSDTIIETFLQTGLSIYGKTNVAEVMDSSKGFQTGIGYYNYESDGDVSAYGNSITGSPEWMVYPFGSQQPQQTNGDTTTLEGSESYALTINGAGSGTTTIAGTGFSTEKVTVNGNIIITKSGVTDTVSGNFGTETLAPSLGEIVDVTIPAERDPNTHILGTSQHEFVIGYMLK
jgi:hypothetical protein